ncbi:adenylyltransferase/cytidyltransferase family protein [Paraglaciecola hydrolytica]|uniref:adenylyltransferase/cytidyltransferase family protein n=1 Tax=Paraglaciecola hydrolytica TaxID=1799789 RepID=UPI0012FF371C|nr:adenylyltransferase/cytidyltransferase family protein [Paraglaciecola hydrolytica]
MLGLTLGKFAPLHLGHQFLIDSALQQVDQLVILIYDCDELPHISLQQRANWIKQLYPKTQVLQAFDGPKQTGYSPEIIAQHNHYLQMRLQDYCFDYFFSSEPYGQHVSEALSCIDVRVDEARSSVPISATLIRQNPTRYQEFLSPIVFNDLMAAHTMLF